MHAFRLNLRDPPEGPPHRDAELVAPHVGIPRSEEFLREALALVAERAITVEHDGGGFVALHHTTDGRDICDIQGSGEPRFRRDCNSPRNMADGILCEGAGVEDRRALLRQELPQLVRRELRSLLVWLHQSGLVDVHHGLTADVGDPGTQSKPHEGDYAPEGMRHDWHLSFSFQERFWLYLAVSWRG